MKSIASVIILGVLLCSGCATSYESSSLVSSGYSETRLAPDVVRVVFHGNSSTKQERAQDLALMRAADLSLQAGYPYFSVLSETAENQQASVEGLTLSTPKIQILVQFLKEKPSGTLAYDAAFIIRAMKEKYKIK
jgi:hypothetical protein